MILSHIQQGSDEWFDARCGVVTASNFKAVMTGGSGKTRRSYMRRLYEEIKTGRPTPPSFQSAAMERGCNLEPRARAAYQAETNQDVREVGIVYLCNERRVAASPDGLIGEEGGLEIKCPLPHNHEKYLRDGGVPRQYIPQIQGNLWVTGRQWWDFVSYAPEMAPAYRLMIRRIYRDESYIAHLRREVERFVQELDEALETRFH
ncbi:MAG: YqaJ viral recombinase family protein [Alphaproteobacteria bacterium]|nr:YqaJ viral recombinase family protein [Alphaproteobacteria bacterium]